MERGTQNGDGPAGVQRAARSASDEAPAADDVPPTTSPSAAPVSRKGKGLAVLATRRPADKSRPPPACVVCLHPAPQFSAATHACGHTACHGCLVRAFTTATSSPDVLPLQCCGRPMDVGLVDAVGLSPAAVAAFRSVNEEATAADKMYCPVASCSAFLNVGRLLATLPTAEVGDFTCRSCSTPLCLKCKRRSHGEVTCAAAAAAETAAATTAADAAMRSLAKEAGWQFCPGCGALIELLYGCNHMTCPCGAQFCYSCGSKWKSCSCNLWEERLLYAADARG